MTDYLYRYVMSPPIRDVGVRADLRRFVKLRETRCGYWVIPEWYQHWPVGAQEQKKRWVNPKARKRLCYPTKEEAWTSFKARMESGRLHTLAKLELFEAACKLTGPEDSVALALEQGWEE